MQLNALKNHTDESAHMHRLRERESGRQVFTCARTHTHTPHMHTQIESNNPQTYRRRNECVVASRLGDDCEPQIRWQCAREADAHHSQCRFLLQERLPWHCPNSAPKARQLPALCLRKEEMWITEWLLAVAIRISIGIGGC